MPGRTPREIETRFAGGRASGLQTVGFGLVGGLIPCPAAITVLLLCLGIGQFWLGIGMVASFSIGLAATLVGVGMAAVLGLRYASSRFPGVDRFLASAPYASAALILLVGGYMAWSGWSHLAPAKEGGSPGSIPPSAAGLRSSSQDAVSRMEQRPPPAQPALIAVSRPAAASERESRD